MGSFTPSSGWLIHWNQQLHISILQHQAETGKIVAAVAFRVADMWQTAC